MDDESSMCPFYYISGINTHNETMRGDMEQFQKENITQYSSPLQMYYNSFEWILYQEILKYMLVILIHY